MWITTFKTYFLILQQIKTTFAFNQKKKNIFEMKRYTYDFLMHQ